MTAETCDVLVVGAGFGGPVAARRCARAGLDTIILERLGSPARRSSRAW
ncbi:MAG: FAD-binding protein [Actinomycetota bacterium]